MCKRLDGKIGFCCRGFGSIASVTTMCQLVSLYSEQVEELPARCEDVKGLLESLPLSIQRHELPDTAVFNAVSLLFLGLHFFW